MKSFSKKRSKREHWVQFVQGHVVVDLLFAAYNGDITALRRLYLTGQDMAAADYDRRTALHLAASEGRLECVQYLVDKCSVPIAPLDRWGHTPHDDAVRFGHAEVERYLASRLA